MQNDVQLRFHLPPEELPRLRNLPRLKALSAGRARTKMHSDTYFDTPGRRLRDRGVALRVYRARGGFHQCVSAPPKRSDGAGREWRGRIPSATPAPQAIGDAELRGLVSVAALDTLEPVFRIDVRRTTRRLVLEDGGEVSLDIDVGEVAAGGAAQPISEIGLTLESGAPRGLFDLALEIQPELGLRLSGDSAVARGYALLNGTPAGPMKAPDLDLSSDATVERALVRTVRHCLDHLMANEACVLESEDPEGVHQMRVALRRLRSALRLFRSVIPDRQYRDIVDEIKWLTGALAATRDWDVLLDEIVGPVVAQFPEDEAFEVLIARLRAERRRSRHAARDAIRSDRYTGFLLRTGGWLADRAWRDQPLSEAGARLFDLLTDLSDALIAKGHDKVRKTAKRFETLSVAERHRLRIDVKRLRYATDFFGALYPRKKVRRYAARLTKIQDALGYRNDVAVARGLVARLGDSSPGDDDAARCRHAGAVVMGWHTHAMAQSEAALATSIARFIDCKPFWP